MTTIEVREPGSGILTKLKVQPVKNFAFPGWVVLIPQQRNILLFLQNGEWRIIPDKISLTYAQTIGEKLTELAL